VATAADVGDGIGPKPRVEQCVVIDAARWQREGILEGFTRSCGGVSFIGYQLETMDMRSPFIHLNYTLSDGRPASGVLQKFNYKSISGLPAPILAGCDGGLPARSAGVALKSCTIHAAVIALAAAIVTT
jgi:hypothetical protein